MTDLSRCELNYDFEPRPSWRNHPSTTDELIDEITTFRRRYETEVVSNEHLRGFCENDFAQAMVVDYICDLNKGELVGTQTRNDTESALKTLLSTGNDSISSTREQRESMNTFKALKMFHEISKKDMASSGLLTVQQICEVHNVLMNVLLLKPGNYVSNCVAPPFRHYAHVPLN